MRVHGFLFTILAVSTLTWGAPATNEAAVEGRTAAAEDTEALTPELYRKNPYGNNGYPYPQPITDNQNGQLEGDVFLAVSKWTLEKFYEFIYKLYEKLNAAVQNKGTGVVTNEDLTELYSVLYVLYDMIQQDAATSYPGVKASPFPLPGSMITTGSHHGTITQAPNSYYPGAYVSATATAEATSKASHNRKRSYGLQLTDREVDEIRKVARKTVRNVLSKLEALLAKNENIDNAKRPEVENSVEAEVEAEVEKVVKAQGNNKST